MLSVVVGVPAGGRTRGPTNEMLDLTPSYFSRLKLWFYYFYPTYYYRISTNANALVIFLDVIDTHDSSSYSLEDVIAGVNGRRVVAIKGRGEGTRIVWESWVFGVGFVGAIWYCEEGVAFFVDHCFTNPHAKFSDLFTDVSKKGVAAPAALKHDGVGLDSFGGEIHCHGCSRPNRVAVNVFWVISQAIES